MDWKADIIGLERVETPEIPAEAIREAVTNSYGHRTYGNNQCNEIDVFKNRIEIHTTGGFPKGHDPAEFLDGNKKAIRRNKLMTRVLYFSKDMETFATGLKRIKDLCDEAGCKVEFRTEKDDFVVAFYRNLREEWNNLGGTPQVTPQDRKRVKENKILEFCHEPRSMQEILVYLGLSDRKNLTEQYIEPLISAGKLERTIPDKLRSKNQRYISK